MLNGVQVWFHEQPESGSFEDVNFTIFLTLFLQCMRV